MAIEQEVKITPAVVIIPLGLLGLGLVGVVAFTALAKPPLPEPPEEGVVVGLLNPPSRANKWQIIIIDDVGIETLIWGIDAHGNIEDAAIFELSPDWLFPLSVDIVIYEEWQENAEWHARQLYRVQSLHPYLWDFDKMEWSDIPDPDYKEVFIPDYGSYYFNVATEQFERVV
ncbi:hypothetical protein ES703_104305 [subsurface metagenome]